MIDPTFWALNLDAPTSIQAEVTGCDPATQGLTYPPATKITFEFPARSQRGPGKVVWYDGNNPIPRPPDFVADDKVPGPGAILFGDKGMIMHGSRVATGCRLLPETVFGYGGPLTQAALLGAIAIRFPGQTLNWDNQKPRFTNHDQANAYLHPAYRKGWSL